MCAGQGSHVQGSCEVSKLRMGGSLTIPKSSIKRVKYGYTRIHVEHAFYSNDYISRVGLAGLIVVPALMGESSTGERCGNPKILKRNLNRMKPSLHVCVTHPQPNECPFQVPGARAGVRKGATDDSLDCICQ